MLGVAHNAFVVARLADTKLGKSCCHRCAFFCMQGAASLCAMQVLILHHLARFPSNAVCLGLMALLGAALSGGWMQPALQEPSSGVLWWLYFGGP